MTTTRHSSTDARHSSTSSTPSAHSTAPTRPETTVAPARLRSVLRANARFSAGCGAVLAAGAPWLGGRLDLPVAVAVVGGLLLVGYGALLWLGSAADGAVPLRRSGWAAVVADEAWVVGAVAVLAATDVLSPAGRWALVAVTVVVAGFAVAQLVALRAMAPAGVR